jgi:hypothetical protein
MDFDISVCHRRHFNAQRMSYHIPLFQTNGQEWSCQHFENVSASLFESHSIAWNTHLLFIDSGVAGRWSASLQAHHAGASTHMPSILVVGNRSCPELC